MVNIKLFILVYRVFAFCFIHVVLILLKKYYTKLWRSLPEDYMNTVTKMKHLITLPDGIINYFNELPTINLINERIIGFLMSRIKSDADAVEFCDIVEKLVNSKSSTIDIEAFRNGMK